MLGFTVSVESKTRIVGVSGEGGGGGGGVGLLFFFSFQSSGLIRIQFGMMLKLVSQKAVWNCDFACC